jgi:hypothetical protein
LVGRVKDGVVEEEEEEEAETEEKEAIGEAALALGWLVARWCEAAWAALGCTAPLWQGKVGVVGGSPRRRRPVRFAAALGLWVGGLVPCQGKKWFRWLVSVKCTEDQLLPKFYCFVSHLKEVFLRSY